MNLDELLNALHTVEPASDAEDVLWSSISSDSLRKLGEMRLIALHHMDDPDALGIIGITELGRSVLIGLLYAMDSGLRYSLDESLAGVFRRAAAVAEASSRTKHFQLTSSRSSNASPAAWCPTQGGGSPS